MIEVTDNLQFTCDECGISEPGDCRLCIAAENGGEFQSDHCGCDKVGEEFWCAGYCEDAFARNPPKKNKGSRKTGRAFRRKMHCKVIKKYRAESKWICGPYLHGHLEGDDYVFDPYIKYPRNSLSRAFFKRVSNKVVRHSKDVLSKGNGYRKIFDYWWKIY